MANPIVLEPKLTYREYLLSLNYDDLRAELQSAKLPGLDRYMKSVNAVTHSQTIADATYERLCDSSLYSVSMRQLVENVATECSVSSQTVMAALKEFYPAMTGVLRRQNIVDYLTTELLTHNLIELSGHTGLSVERICALTGTKNTDAKPKPRAGRPAIKEYCYTSVYMPAPPRQTATLAAVTMLVHLAEFLEEYQGPVDGPATSTRIPTLMNECEMTYQMTNRYFKSYKYWGDPVVWCGSLFEGENYALLSYFDGLQLYPDLDTPLLLSREDTPMVSAKAIAWAEQRCVAHRVNVRYVWQALYWYYIRSAEYQEKSAILFERGHRDQFDAAVVEFDAQLHAKLYAVHCASVDEQLQKAPCKKGVIRIR